MKQVLHFTKIMVAACSIFLISSCGSSVTNVWDYYVTNEVIVHKQNQTSISKRKLIHRENDGSNKSQLDLVAVRQDSMSYLVIGSHMVAKSFYFNDSLYSFNVNDLYSNVRGNDFIRQMGDLSIFYTHVSAERVTEFLSNFDRMRKAYQDAKVVKGATTQLDFYFSHNVFISFEKTSANQKPSKCYVWVGRRKHQVDTDDLQEAFAELKNFK